MTAATLDDTKTRNRSKKFDQEYFETLLRHADRMLGMTTSGIALAFSEHTLYVTQCHEKGATDEYIEVIFDEESEGLVCNFSEEKKCTMVFLFLAIEESCAEYVRYLNSTYMHAGEKCCWKMPKGVLSLLRDNRNYYFGYFSGLTLPE